MRNGKNIKIILFLAITAIVCKFFQFNFLPDVYFTDQTYILEQMKYTTEAVGTGFYNASLVFKTFNVFNLDSIFSWSILLTIIGNIILFFILKRDQEKKSIITKIFILASVFLLNIYIFNLGKDFFQFVLIAPIYFLKDSQKISKNKKLLITILLLLINTIFFRTYFGIIIALFLAIYILSQKQRKTWLIVAFSLLLLLLSLFVLEKAAPDIFTKITSAREITTSTLNANTEIDNLIQGDTLSTFILNYLLNLLRIVMPIELFSKGIFCSLFALFQIFTILCIFYKINRNIGNNLYFILFISYILCVALFEPDFGSVVRHEITIFPILLALFELKKITIPKIEETQK